MSAKPQSFAKRDAIRSIEVAVQAEWEQAKAFEIDAPADDANAPGKYFANFPYPYMNGRLHLGHGYALLKAEYETRFQAMLGKRAIFPFGFHCTGMPIKAAADKLKQELKEFGSPPRFPEAPHYGRPCLTYEMLEDRRFVVKETTALLLAEFEEQADASHKEALDAAKASAAAGAKAAPVSKKAKVAQKTGGAKRQWDILLASGVPGAEIPQFVNSMHWLSYFPPIGVDDLKQLGTGIDFRRSFITTDVNPYYDAFVRWQFNCLHKAGKLKFGKRHTIYSPTDKQACADHDRASGEGVMPQEYTLIKLRLVEPLPAALSSIANRAVFLVAATLRPETMYGQTNCYVLPTGTYGAFAINADANGDIFVMSDRAALNLAYQGYSPTHGVPSCVARVTGEQLIGAALAAPLATYAKVYVLPMLTISMAKGTGVVTSVPSDSPDDWAMLRELQKKPAWRESFGLKDDMVMPFEPVKIIRTSEFGDLSAVTACDKFKVNSPKDAIQLATAKEAVYKAGFYDGVFLVGACAGEKVSDGKTKIRQLLLDAAQAIIYWEPASLVMSRSGDECVVCLTDQWYIDYAQPEWKKQVIELVRSMDTFGDDLRALLESNVERLHEWGCSRSFGLGSRLPADPAYVIESLSDSTIYMAYYTIAHLLQGGNIDPVKVVVGPLGIRPEQCTDALFDYVFRGEGTASAVGVDAAALDRLRREFTYWYPWDLRSSGKDLAYNHLPFALFNHVALFPRALWPRGIKCCAFLEVDGKKMSKSEGNFLTIADGVERFSADGLRLACADAGDTLDVANFDQGTADLMVLRLYVLNELAASTVAMPADAARASGTAQPFDERVFEQWMRQCVAECRRFYGAMMYRDVVRIAMHAFSTMRERYVLNSGGARRSVLLAALRTQALMLAPIAPHIAQNIWKTIGETGLIARALFPAVETFDASLLLAADHLYEQLTVFRRKLDTYLHPRAPKKGAVPTPPAHPQTATIGVSPAYPAWQAKVLELVRPHFDASTNEFTEGAVGALKDNAELAALLPPAAGKKNVAMVYYGAVKSMAKEVGTNALRTQLPFDELKLFSECEAHVRAALGVANVVVVADNSEASRPGYPEIAFK